MTSGKLDFDDLDVHPVSFIRDHEFLDYRVSQVFLNDFWRAVAFEPF